MEPKGVLGQVRAMMSDSEGEGMDMVVVKTEVEDPTPSRRIVKRSKK
jgi:hypothetical protein